MTDLFPYPKVIFSHGIINFIWGNMPASAVCLKHKRYWSEGASFDEGVCQECTLRAIDQMKGDENYRHYERWRPHNEWVTEMTLETLNSKNQCRTCYNEYGI